MRQRARAAARLEHPGGTGLMFGHGKSPGNGIMPLASGTKVMREVYIKAKRSKELKR